MKLGLQHPNFSYDGDGPQLVDGLKRIVTRAESFGFDSFWVMDHFHQIPYVGVEYFIVNLETQRELEALELLGKEIVKKF